MMLTDSPYVAKRTQPGIPIWDIEVRGTYVGILTDLPMEASPMATVRYDGNEVTFSGETIYEVLEQVGDWLADIDSYNEMLAQEAAAIYEAEYYAEVIGPMKAAEDAAERWAEQAYANEPPEAF